MTGGGARRRRNRLRKRAAWHQLFQPLQQESASGCHRHDRHHRRDEPGPHRRPTNASPSDQSAGSVDRSVRVVVGGPLVALVMPIATRAGREACEGELGRRPRRVPRRSYRGRVGDGGVPSPGTPADKRHPASRRRGRVRGPRGRGPYRPFASSTRPVFVVVGFSVGVAALLALSGLSRNVERHAAGRGIPSGCSPRSLSSCFIDGLLIGIGSTLDTAGSSRQSTPAPWPRSGMKRRSVPPRTVALSITRITGETKTEVAPGARADGQRGGCSGPSGERGDSDDALPAST